MKLLDNSLCKVEIAALEITRTQFEDRELYAQALVTLTIVKKEVFRINVSYRDDYEELRAIVDDLRYSPWEFKTPDQVLVFNQIVDRLEKKVHEPE